MPRHTSSMGGCKPSYLRPIKRELPYIASTPELRRELSLARGHFRPAAANECGRLRDCGGGQSSFDCCAQMSPPLICGRGSEHVQSSGAVFHRGLHCGYLSCAAIFPEPSGPSSAEVVVRVADFNRGCIDALQSRTLGLPARHGHVGPDTSSCPGRRSKPIWTVLQASYAWRFRTRMGSQWRTPFQTAG